MSAERVCIDRIEDDIAVLETAEGEYYSVPAGALPEGAGEGTWLHLSMAIDLEATKKAAVAVAELRAQLSDGESGDFSL